MNVMIAHVNRVMSAYKKDVCESLFDYADLIFQINCEAFRGLLLRDPFGAYGVSDLRFVLGTDTHDIGKRAPDFDIALKKLKRKRSPESAESSCHFFQNTL